MNHLSIFSRIVNFSQQKLGVEIYGLKEVTNSWDNFLEFVLTLIVVWLINSIVLIK